MRSEIIVNAIARSGGFFFTGLIDEADIKKFLIYLRRNDMAEIISRSFKNDFGFLLKLRDDLITKYYPYDGRKKRYYLTHADNGKQRGSRYHVSDFKLYHSFVKFSVWKKYYYSIVSKNEEKKFFIEHKIPDHREIGKSICYAYDYSEKKVIVIIMDFDKSFRSMLDIIEFYNDEKYSIIISTLKQAKMFESDLFEKLNKKYGNLMFNLKPEIRVINFPDIDKFFGV